MDNNIVLANKTYQLSPLTVADMEELQQWVYTQLPNPITIAKEIAKDLPDEVAKDILINAYEDVRAGARKIGTPEVSSLMKTLPGFREMLFLLGRKHQPSMTREDWEGILIEAASQDVESVTEKIVEESGGALPDPKASSAQTTLYSSSQSVTGGPQSKSVA